MKNTGNELEFLLKDLAELTRNSQHVDANKIQEIIDKYSSAVASENGIVSISDVFVKEISEVEIIDFTVDKNFKIVEYNNNLLEVLGEFVPGLKLEDMTLESFPFTDEQKSRIKKITNQVLEGRRFVDIIKVGEQGKYYEAIWSPVTDKSNIVSKVSIILRDISNILGIESKLIESENKFRRIAENTSDVIWTVNKNLKYDYVSPSIFYQRGFTPEEFVKLELNDVYTKKSLDIINGLYNHFRTNYDNGIMPDDPSLIIELEHKCKNGSSIIGEVHINALFDEDNKFVGFQGITRNIDERKKAQKALEQRENEYRQLFENLTDVFYKIKLDGTILSVSPSLYRLSGLTPEEVIGTNVLNFYEDGERRKELISIMQKEGEVADFEIVMLDKYRNPKYVSINSHLIKEANESDSFLIGVLHDITEKVHSRINSDYYIALQQLLLKISEDLLRSDTVNMESTLMNSLRLLGEFFVIDRTYIFSYDSKNNTVTNTHEWCRDGIESQIETLQNIPLESLPKWSEQIIENHIFRMQIDEDLGIEWKAERELLERQNIKSVLSLPLIYKDEIIGLVGYDSVQNKRIWTETEIQVLNVFCNQLSGVLMLYKTLQSLSASENRYETFINATSDLVFLKDDNGRYLFSNKENASLYHLSPETIIGKSDKELMPEEMYINCMRSDHLALITKEVLLVEEIINDHIFEVRKFPVQINKNKYGIGGFIRDITDKKNAEKKLLNHSLWLSQLNDLSGKLAAASYQKIFSVLADSIKQILNVKYSWIALYDEEKSSLMMKHHAMSSRENLIIKSIFGGKIPSFSIKISAEMYSTLYQNQVLIFDSIAAATFGQIPETIANLMQSALGIGWIMSISLIADNKIVGGLGISGYKNQPKPDVDDLKLLSGLAANAIIRKEAEEELKERELQLSNLINNIPGLIFRRKIEKPWTLEYLSSVCPELTGYDVSELLKNEHLTFAELLNKSNYKKIKSAINKALDEKSGYIVDYQIVKKDGSLIWVQEHASIVYDENDKAIAVEGVITNVDELKTATQSVFTHKNKLTNLIKTLPDLLFLIDLKGKIIEFYASETALLALPEDKILQSSIFDIFTHDEAQKHLEYFQYAHKYNETVAYDYSMFLLNEKYYFEARASRNDENTVLCVVRDITEKRKAEETIRKLLTGIEQSASSVVITDRYAKIEYVNSFFTYITGYTFEEVKGKNPNVLKSGKTNPAVYREMWATLLNGDDWHGEFLNKNKSGEEFWETVTISPIKNQEGEIVNFIAVKSDITFEKKMLEDLIATKEKAEESDNLKSAFLRNISHEIRTPMNAILGFTELLDNNECSPEQISKYFKIISESGNNLLNVIDNILIMSGLVTGQDKYKPEACDLREILSSVFDDFYPMANKKNLQFKFNTFAEDFNSHFFIDKKKINVVLNQLISNAIKFTNNGFVNYGCEITDDEIRFYVLDTGVGIPKNKETEIFDQFRQLDNELTKIYGGMGLGLTISKSMVELMGGKIWYESDGISGTVFYFSVPRASDNNIIITKMTNQVKTDSNKEITILVAEDEYFNYLLIEHILTSLGMKVIHTENGQQAVDVCKSNPEIDLVIMDIKMPVMDGYTATKLIKEYRPELFVIAQTAYALIGDKEKALANGCDDYISKPISQTKLVEILVKYISLPKFD